MGNKKLKIFDLTKGYTLVRDIENGLALIEKWLRNKNTIEFLGIWEEIYNPAFNYTEFEGNELPPLIEAVASCFSDRVLFR